MPMDKEYGTAYMRAYRERKRAEYNRYHREYAKRPRKTKTPLEAVLGTILSEIKSSDGDYANGLRRAYTIISGALL